MLVMARGFMHLNAFDITRALIFIMRETLKDMVSFLLVLILSVAAFSILNMIALQINDKNGVFVKTRKFVEPNITESFFSTYLLLFGENVGRMNYLETTLQKLLYFIASLILPIMTLNLLISIISDTYDRVRDTISASDLKLKAELMLGIEQIALFFSTGSKV